MARVTEDQVRSILLDDYDKDNAPSLLPFITAANIFTDRLYTKALAKGITLPVKELTAVEQWLSAHCYVMSDQNYTSRNTDSASGSFQGQTAMNFDASKYGQTAVALDSSGLLASINKQARASAMLLRCDDISNCSCD